MLLPLIDETKFVSSRDERPGINTSNISSYNKNSTKHAMKVESHSLPCTSACKWNLKFRGSICHPNSNHWPVWNAIGKHFCISLAFSECNLDFCLTTYLAEFESLLYLTDFLSIEVTAFDQRETAIFYPCDVYPFSIGLCCCKQI